MTPSTVDRDEHRIVEVLRQNGETAITTLRDVVALSDTRTRTAIARLAADGAVIVRDFDGGRRSGVRLAGQPIKHGIEAGLRGTAAQPGQHWRDRRDEAERAAAGDGLTFTEIVLQAFVAASDAGLTMTQATEALASTEPADVIREKVRALWRAGKLARRRDGTFVAGGTRSWHAAELDRDEAIA